MTILTETVDEVFPGWISSKTLEPQNYWSRSSIEECDTILECACDALLHRLLKNVLKRIFFQGTVPLAVRCFNVAIIMGTFLGYGILVFQAS
jgi:hypothetical protein